MEKDALLHDYPGECYAHIACPVIPSQLGEDFAVCRVLGSDQGSHSLKNEKSGMKQNKTSSRVSPLEPALFSSGSRGGL